MYIYLYMYKYIYINNVYMCVSMYVCVRVCVCMYAPWMCVFMHSGLILTLFFLSVLFLRFYFAVF